jgi:hypothetical protein
MQYDPKLKKAIAQIESIIKEYDIAGLVILANGQGNSEWISAINPTWSALFWENTPRGPLLRIRLKRAEVGEENAKIIANRTADLLAHMVDQAGRHFMTMKQLLDMVKEKWDIDDTDPGETTYPFQQNN